MSYGLQITWQVLDMELWEKQKGESRKAFQAFAIYRDMGMARSYTAVAQELQKSGTLIRRWAGRWSWEQRVDAYDAHIDEQARKKHEAERVAMSERQYRLARAMSTRVAESMQSMIDKKEVLTHSDIPRWLDTAVRIERLVMGEVTERTEVVEGDAKQRLAAALDRIVARRAGPGPIGTDG